MFVLFYNQVRKPGKALRLCLKMGFLMGLTMSSVAIFLHILTQEYWVQLMDKLSLPIPFLNSTLRGLQVMVLPSKG